MSTNTSVTTLDGGSMGAYRAAPEGQATAAIVVIQEIFGVNAGIRRKCDALAAAGYLAIAPDLFWRIRPGIELDPDVDAEMQEALGLIGQFDQDAGIRDITFAPSLDAALAAHLAAERAAGRVVVGYAGSMGLPNALDVLLDAAKLLQAQGADIVVTTDAIVEGVHFLADDPPETIARKALRVNLSDIAAKGAKPVGFLHALSLNASIDDAYLTRYAAGLAEDVKEFAVPLLGGDTTSGPGPLTITITATSREQLDDTYRALTSHPLVKVVL